MFSREIECKTIKILNNNVVLAQDLNKNRELIIVGRGEEKLGPLNQHIHIALTDHIGFAVERIKEEWK